MHPRTLLFILIGMVPLAVAGAGVVSFVLLRTGHGLLVGMLVPFLVLLAVAGGLGAILGRAAGGGAPRKSEGGRTEGDPRRR